MAREVPVPVRLGLVETMASKCHARFGYWPEDYIRMVRMYCNGQIPQRVRDLSADLKELRPWEPAEDPHPGMVRIWIGPHSFLVPREEVIGARPT